MMETMQEAREAAARSRDLSTMLYLIEAVKGGECEAGEAFAWIDGLEYYGSQDLILLRLDIDNVLEVEAYVKEELESNREDLKLLERATVTIFRNTNGSYAWYIENEAGIEEHGNEITFNSALIEAAKRGAFFYYNRFSVEGSHKLQAIPEDLLPEEAI